MNKDLTVGKPSYVLFNFCLPLIGSVFFQQLYNVADSLVVGKFIGEAALAAVGNSYEITLIFIAFSMGFNIGCSVVVSRLFGGKLYNDLKTSVYTSLIGGFVLCFILFLIGFFFCSRILMLINTPQDIFSDSWLYLKIYIFGFPFMFLYNISTGVFTALGDSRTPFIFLAVSSTSNIVVDTIFVYCLNMGVAGVAWATFICQSVSCILSMLFLVRRISSIKTKGNITIFSWNLMWKISKVAIPSIFQQSFISVGNIILQSIINSFGASVIAGYSAGVKLNNLVITSFTTMGNGITNYTSQNIGAKKLDRVDEGFKAGVKMIWIITLPIVIIYFFFGKSLCLLFMNKSAEAAIATGGMFLKILSPFYFIVCVKLAADGVLRGAGRMKEFMISTFSDLILRVIIAFGFSKVFGSVGIWMSWPVGWIIGTTLSYVFFRKISYKDEYIRTQSEN